MLEIFRKYRYTIVGVLGVILILVIGFNLVIYLNKQGSQDKKPQEILGDQKKSVPTNSKTPQTNLDTKIMGWIYPGSPACSVQNEVTDGRKIDVLKPEYMKLDEEGKLIYLTDEEYDCNGYNKKNAQFIKENSNQAIFMVSGRWEGLQPFFKSVELQKKAIEDIVKTIKEIDFDGVEIDFEDFASWSDKDYTSYKNFLKMLGDRLDTQNKLLSIDVPAIKNDRYQSFYKLKYEDFVDLPIDYFTIMAYDFQYDEGVGSPVASFDDIRETLEWTQKKFPDKSRTVVGLNNYGYWGNNGEFKMSLGTKEQILKRFKGIESEGKRDEKSGEFIAKKGNQSIVWSDSESLEKKRELVTSLGYNKISVWHIGGNDWFPK